MKKILYLLTIVALLTMTIFTTSNMVMAATPLNSVETKISKDKIAPGEEVTVTVNFGTELGAYTVNVAYDNAIFDYVSSDEGTPTDDGSRVKLVFYDSTGGSATRNNANITFRAKDTILTSNPTDFAITLQGMANGDASVTYDDILVPIEKDILVEPNYVDYALSLEYTGTIEPNVQKDMTLITESSMGKNYDHVRMIAEVTKKPSDDASVQLLATNEQDQELDLIQNGWGEADGYALGGKDVRQELLLKGEFSEVGDYTVNIKIIDRDDSDVVVAQKDFNFTVSERPVNNGEEPTVPPTEETPSEGETTVPEENKNNEEMPETLPKTGNTQYGIIIGFIAILVVAYIVINHKNSKQN